MLSKLNLYIILHASNIDMEGGQEVSMQKQQPKKTANKTGEQREPSCMSKAAHEKNVRPSQDWKAGVRINHPEGVMGPTQMSRRTGASVKAQPSQRRQGGQGRPKTEKTLSNNLKQPARQ